MGNFCSFMKKKINNESIMQSNINSPFITFDIHTTNSNDAEIYKCDEKDIPSYSQV
jgi:hypothetical protein